MQNAAIFLHPDAFDTTTGRLMGRHAAGESFLRGYLRHAEVERYDFWNVSGAPRQKLEAMVAGIGATRHPVRWIDRHDRAALNDPGVLNLPGPSLNQETWLRRPVGARAYASCAITHTTATPRIMDAIAGLLIDPVEDYDALICTSSAVRAAVETQLDGIRDYLTAEFGPRRRPEPQRVTIPLGVNAEDFTPSADHRRAWRERLNIPADAPVALYVGRFNVKEKMNPGLMAVALEKTAAATGQTIYWVNSGWSEDQANDDFIHRETRALCPSVRYIAIDGRAPDVRFSIWSVADFFISFSDNIQETFGLTPIEAMAAGLPCVVTDWNGYKDTVRHGIDGFRVSTLAPPPGAGEDLSQALAAGLIGYTSYVAAAAQHTVIDYGEAVSALSILVLNPAFRRQLGENARARAREVFDWAAIIPQYQALWAEMNARRLAAPLAPFEPANPFRPDPYRLFGGYPTAHLTPDYRLALPPGVTPAAATALLRTNLSDYAAMNRPTPSEVQTILTWLSECEEGVLARLVETFPPDRRRHIRRGVLWMARLGAISILAPA